MAPTDLGCQRRTMMSRLKIVPSSMSGGGFWLACMASIPIIAMNTEVPPHSSTLIRICLFLQVMGLSMWSTRLKWKRHEEMR